MRLSPQVRVKVAMGPRSVFAPKPLASRRSGKGCTGGGVQISPVLGGVSTIWSSGDFPTFLASDAGTSSTYSQHQSAASRLSRDLAFVADETFGPNHPHRRGSYCAQPSDDRTAVSMLDQRRARGAPDRTVIEGKSRSPTGTPSRQLPAST